MLLLAVAVLAARDHVGLGGSAAADERHHVVHGQLLRRKRPLAVVALASGPFALPPLRAAQRLGLGFLSGDVLGVGWDEVAIFHSALSQPLTLLGIPSPTRAEDRDTPVQKFA